MKGAREALRAIFPDGCPSSVLDVGCGSGTWLAAAVECGATTVLGVDGAHVPASVRHISEDRLLITKLDEPLDLGRKFDLILCLETAEHLDAASAGTIIDTLARHGDMILFSAAVPGQKGTHHVNCQWPAYWQALFNARGFACSDAVRWAIWNNELIEPWYRQNLMLAVRDGGSAGHERRIAPVLHPQIVEHDYLMDQTAAIEAGAQPATWYVLAPFKAARAKLSRAFRRSS